ncbi:RnfABCDGE type electron transport complex subunit B [Phytopseudomonas dryadis]|uniref:Electron transporter RnfB n=1 Tax=Phytopseudomonas dryadis TaxID=2487520 RepID=A0A4Q9R451_9GAMM|nr:RnfABCDGE type electron transport complex subunit B [Pseudomonas dryadis]TBU94720.1 electron transporter RnfB [Pseudomonas dryadis]
MSNALRIQAIDALLPQTQCGKCGHPGCLPYAEGIAAGEAINKCPPGGSATIHALARLLQVPELPLELPAVPAQIAVIREAECIGCTKCIQACPVDAIVGAAKQMHTVINDECSGCELCIAPCPVDCIDLIVLAGAQAEEQRQRADQFRERHQARQARLAREDARRRAVRAARGSVSQNAPPATLAPQPLSSDNAALVKRLKIDAAMSRAQLHKALKAFGDTPNAQQQRQLDALQLAADEAQRALAALQPVALPAAAPSAGEMALKQAKITVAGRRAELQAAERRGLEEAALAPLRAAYGEAQQALQHAEEHCGKPPPDRVRVNKAPVDTQLRALKTELAYARAELSKLQRRETTDASTLDKARQRLADAEQRLHDYPGA